MAQKSIEERVLQTIGESLGQPIEKVTPDKNLTTDLDADSLDQIELCMSLEDEFGVEFLNDDAEKITTVQHAIDLVHKYIQAKA